MTPTELLAASRREHELYRELVSIYGALGGLLTDERAAPSALTAAAGEAARVSAALARLDATLASARAAGSVPADVAALWQQSAALAARAGATNRTLLAHATRRRDRAAAIRRARSGPARPAAGYAPAVTRRPGLDARA